MGVECFLIVEGEEADRFLRRYASKSECPNGGIHNASVPIGRHALIKDRDGSHALIDPDSYLTHPGWPTHCSCGYEFTEDDERQIKQDAIYVAADGRGEWTLRDAPPGSIWTADWMPDRWRINGGDGPAYVIKLPNGHEFIPGTQASNCDRAGEDHDCWCVHGDASNLTINKTPAPGRSTCTAGAGSIWSKQGQPDQWHGFVTNGELVQV